ncbi:MAG TPA: hypothetical protein VGS21_05070, partial [Acidimicrobiales bacterium]|nr:hypothetical protein [Acidimicrobiales bacterium]
IGAALGHLIEAWELAMTGSDVPLGELADEEATTVLLRPRRYMRLIIRDAVLKSWEPKRLVLDRRHPLVHAAITVDAVRYLVAEDGRRQAGNADDPHQMTLIWTLELTDSQETPWRLVASSNPAELIPGAWSPSGRARRTRLGALEARVARRPRGSRGT